jgi:hypothetical protein
MDDDRFKYFLDTEQKFRDTKIADLKKMALESSSEKRINQD